VTTVKTFVEQLKFEKRMFCFCFCFLPFMVGELTLLVIMIFC
jgi:hypothetical protein